MDTAPNNRVLSVVQNAARLAERFQQTKVRSQQWIHVGLRDEAVDREPEPSALNQRSIHLGSAEQTTVGRADGWAQLFREKTFYFDEADFGQLNKARLIHHTVHSDGLPRLIHIKSSDGDHISGNDSIGAEIVLQKIFPCGRLAGHLFTDFDGVDFSQDGQRCWLMLPSPRHGGVDEGVRLTASSKRQGQTRPSHRLPSKK